MYGLTRATPGYHARPMLTRYRLAALAAASALLVFQPALADPLPEDMAEAVQQTQKSWPGLARLARVGDAWQLTGVAEAPLEELLAELRSGRVRPGTDAALAVLFAGLARQQGALATSGRTLMQDVVAAATAGGTPAALDTAARALVRVLDDPYSQYTALAQDLLSEILRCAASASGHQPLVDAIAARVDAALGLAERERDVGVWPELRARADLGAVAARGERVLAAGAFGTVLVSPDAGTTWASQDTGTDQTLFAVALGPGQEAWAVGRSGAVVHSADGERWERRPTPFLRHFFGVLAPGPGEALVVGDFGLQLASDDGGQRWRCLPRGEDVILGRVARGAGDALVVGEFGTLERLPAGYPPGRQGRLDGVADDTYLFDAWLADDGQRGIAVGLEGTLLRTRDGGASWQRAEVGLDADLYAVDGAGQRVVVVGEGGLVASSRDGGRSFRVARAPPLPLPLLDVAFADGRSVYAVGPAGSILVSRDGGESFVALRGPGLP